MSEFKLKNISSWNLEFIPKYTNNISTKLNNSKKLIKNSCQYDPTDDYLYIYCIQKVYGHRVGIFGYIAHLSSFYLSKICNPLFLKYIINNTFLKKLFGKIDCNDFEAIAYLLGSINSKIPLLNLGIWDIKPYLKDNLYCFINKNESIPHWFNIFNDRFDSGCAIYSNKKAKESGFQKWILNKNKNTGITWSFFDYDKKILVVNVEINDNLNDMFYMNCITQLLNFCELKEKHYKLDNILITGDFKINLLCKTKDMSKIVLETMKTNNFTILNSDSNNFIFSNNSNLNIGNLTYFSLKISPNSYLRSTINYSKNNDDDEKLNINSEITIDIDMKNDNDNLPTIKEIVVEIPDTKIEQTNTTDNQTTFTEINLDTYNPLNLITNYFKNDNSSSSKTSRSQSPSENEWTKL